MLLKSETHSLNKREENLIIQLDYSQKWNQTCVFDTVNIFSHMQQALSLVSLVDFLGKIEEDRVRKVLSMTSDEFL